jgi:hypothetical protein
MFLYEEGAEMGFWKIVLSTAIVVVLCGGCDEDLKRISSSEMPPKWDLVGTWVNPSEDTAYPDDSFEFRSDGTFSSVEHGVLYEGTWTLKGDVLSRTAWESGVMDDGNGNKTPYYQKAVTVAVVDDGLYIETLNRFDGDSENLDGAWKLVGGLYRIEVENGISQIYGKMFNVIAEITDSSFSSVTIENRRDYGISPSYSNTTTDVLEGVVYQTGGFVGLVDPDLMPPDGLPDDLNIYDSYYYFFYFGFRVSKDVILFGALSADQAAQEAFTKVK